MHCLLSFLLGRRPQGSWSGPISSPFPPSPNPPPDSGQSNSLHLNTHLPGLQADGLGISARLPSTTPSLASHDRLALGLFFSPRGIARVMQRRTLPRGRLSTPAGGAVPPSWPGSLCADSGSPLVTSTQTSCISEHFVRQTGLQDQKNLQRSAEPLGAVAVSYGGGPDIPKALTLHKTGFHLSASLRTWGEVWT